LLLFVVCSIYIKFYSTSLLDLNPGLRCCCAGGLVGVPHKDAEFKTHPMNLLNERALKGTFFDNYKPHTDLCNVIELYMKKVNAK